MEGNYKKWINRINSKQDVLDETNLGEIIDTQLSIKMTPSASDELVTLDSISELSTIKTILRIV